MGCVSSTQMDQMRDELARQREQSAKQLASMHVFEERMAALVAQNATLVAAASHAPATASITAPSEPEPDIQSSVSASKTVSSAVAAPQSVLAASKAAPPLNRAASSVSKISPQSPSKVAAAAKSTPVKSIERPPTLNRSQTLPKLLSSPADSTSAAPSVPPSPLKRAPTSVSTASAASASSLTDRPEWNSATPQESERRQKMLMHLQLRHTYDARRRVTNSNTNSSNNSSPLTSPLVSPRHSSTSTPATALPTAPQPTLTRASTLAPALSSPPTLKRAATMTSLSPATSPIAHRSAAGDIGPYRPSPLRCLLGPIPNQQQQPTSPTTPVSSAAVAAVAAGRVVAKEVGSSAVQDANALLASPVKPAKLAPARLLTVELTPSKSVKFSEPEPELTSISVAESLVSPPALPRVTSFPDEIPMSKSSSAAALNVDSVNPSDILMSPTNSVPFSPIVQVASKSKSLPPATPAVLAFPVSPTTSSSPAAVAAVASLSSPPQLPSPPALIRAPLSPTLGRISPQLPRLSPTLPRPLSPSVGQSSIAPEFAEETESEALPASTDVAPSVASDAKVESDLPDQNSKPVATTETVTSVQPVRPVSLWSAPVESRPVGFVPPPPPPSSLLSSILQPRASSPASVPSPQSSSPSKSTALPAVQSASAVLAQAKTASLSAQRITAAERIMQSLMRTATAPVESASVVTSATPKQHFLQRDPQEQQAVLLLEQQQRAQQAQQQQVRAISAGRLSKSSSAVSISSQRTLPRAPAVQVVPISQPLRSSASTTSMHRDVEHALHHDQKPHVDLLSLLPSRATHVAASSHPTVLQHYSAVQALSKSQSKSSLHSKPVASTWTDSGSSDSSDDEDDRHVRHRNALRVQKSFSQVSQPRQTASKQSSGLIASMSSPSLVVNPESSASLLSPKMRASASSGALLRPHSPSVVAVVSAPPHVRTFEPIRLSEQYQVPSAAASSMMSPKQPTRAKDQTSKHQTVRQSAFR